MTITFLGTGSAIPLPRHRHKFDATSPLHDCPQCLSKDTRDKRWPSALLVTNKILIDASEHILDLLASVKAEPTQIEAILLTHRHSDAAGGSWFFPLLRPVLPTSSRSFVVKGHRFESVQVPHDNRTWGYLIDDRLAYFSDYADIRPTLPVLERAKVAVLDGSGWDSTFPSHQPMAEVIPAIKKLTNLARVYFTHNGHTTIPHARLEDMARKLGGERFALAHHGLEIVI